MSVQAYSVLPLHSLEKLQSKEYKRAWEDENNVQGVCSILLKALLYLVAKPASTLFV